MPASPHKPFPPRIHVLLARHAPAAVVIRRGPSKQTRLILWNRTRDTFEPIQWIKARLYERRCDLSPDGRLFAYFALTGHYDSPAGGTFTAISRPPYFTALALWPKGDSWHGGGLFVDFRTFYLHGPHQDPLVPPRGEGAVCVVAEMPSASEGNSECLDVYFTRLRRDGWSVSADGESTRRRRMWRWQKRGPGMRLAKQVIVSISPSPGRGVHRDEHALIVDSSGAQVPLPDADWADVDHHRSRIVYAAAGKLWEASLSGDQLQRRELADFNDMSFQAIVSPAWARSWPKVGR